MKSFIRKVKLEKNGETGKIVIDFFTPDDLHAISNLIAANKAMPPANLMEKFIAAAENPVPSAPPTETPLDDRSKAEKEKEEKEGAELYSIKNFTV